MDMRQRVLNTLSTIKQELDEDMTSHAEGVMSDEKFFLKAKEHANAMQATLSCLRVKA
jgi:hypothetical protein